MTNRTQPTSTVNRGGRSRRGFASMDPEKRREIARKGGRASHGGRGSDYESQTSESSRAIRSDDALKPNESSSSSSPFNHGNLREDSQNDVNQRDEGLGRGSVYDDRDSDYKV